MILAGLFIVPRILSLVISFPGYLSASAAYDPGLIVDSQNSSQATGSFCVSIRHRL